MEDYEGHYIFEGGYIRFDGIAIPEDVVVAHLNIKDNERATLQAEVDTLVEMLEAIKHNAIREDANTDQDIGIWIARFSDEGMASLKILIDKHRSM